MRLRWLWWLRWLSCRPIRSTTSRPPKVPSFPSAHYDTHPTSTHHAASEIQNATSELSSIEDSEENAAQSHTQSSPHPTPSSLVQNPNPLSLSTHTLELCDDTSHQSNSPGAPRSISEAGSLHNSLRQARIQCSNKNNHKFFVPDCELKKLITVEVVTPILQKILPSTADARINDLAKSICESAPRLFATLGYIKKEHEILPLLEEQVSDEDFPFQLKHPQPLGSHYALQGKGGKDIISLAKWNDEVSEEFQRCQWWMMAPNFNEGSHYILDDNAMLPFTERREISKGGYSRVHFAKIHPSHHNFSGVKRSDSEGCHVAIKELSTANHEDIFKKETAFFATLAKKRNQPHPHLINLLATYQWKGKYHLMFPHAKENLESYWRHTKPVFDEDTMRWWLKQLAGLVSGLLEIHESRIQTPPGTTSAPEGSGSSIRLKRGEEKYGRHGDIKPENILWFPPSSASDNPGGILTIADFGLSRFHGRDTRSNVDWSQIKSSPTYEPPELKLHKPVSRAYDMWSLACILLEFATWALKGQEGNENFSSNRSCPDSNPDLRELSNDEFFNIVGENRSRAEVREGVVKWVEELYQSENCTAFIQDLLNMTMRHLLVVNPAHRYSAIRLNQEFKHFEEKAKDSEYLIKPIPQTTTSTAQGTPHNKPENRSVTHRIGNISSPRARTETGVSKLRYPGTSKKSKTWPDPRVPGESQCMSGIGLIADFTE
ncbi:kinase-like protein [Lindgomyces ingoldianus]|uniref:Kinase-like protein n=1 Tax=Lindgomyces ingoldianus TaxID=673940 RepID=A0ACB6QFT2_9PLEO|nr:kinase-like protein [Lindgomyces ingoldianus]KAF2465828.1 kinase-like protein [Lindgomyces ingoldianus]